MKKSVTILGSAAAEGIPAIFCHCRVCRQAWEKGGKNVRMRTAYKLNDRVRIDFGPDSMAQEFQFQLHSENLKHLFITHSHEDHFVPDMLDYRQPGFSAVPEDQILNLYGNAGVLRKLMRHFWELPGFTGDFRSRRLNPVLLESFHPVELPEEDMTFHPLPANHMGAILHEKPNVFAVRWGEKQILFANDTGFFREDAWQYLEKNRFRFDLVILDCTCGKITSRDGHLGGDFVIGLKARMEKNGLFREDGTFCINHFSHNGGLLHEELEEHFAPFGIAVGFDGCIWEL